MNTQQLAEQSLNRGLVQSMFMAIDRRNWRELERLFHADIVYERGGYSPFRGREAVMHFYRAERLIAQGEHRLDEIVIDRNYGACWGRFDGLKKDNTPIDVYFADVYSFDSGKVIFRKSHFFVPLV